MRVLLANGYAYPRGGDALQMLDSARRLRAAGHEVGVFAIRHAESEFREWSEFWPEEVDFRAETGPLSSVRLAARSAYSRAVARRLTDMVHAFRPDVAHLHSVHHHLTVSAPQALFRAGVPVVWTLHDYRTVCPSTHLMVRSQPCERCADGRFYRALPLACKSDSPARTAVAVGESYLSRLMNVSARVDRFIAPSRFLASTLDRMGFRNASIDVLPNPIDVGAVAAPTEFKTDVLYVGRLSGEKGPDVLLRACRKLPGLHVTFVGDGPMIDELSSYATQHGVQVDFVGWQPREVVREWMRASRVLCVPSVCYENCPGVVLEGMAIGIPVVASDLGGLPELLERGRCGDLVVPGDDSAWAAAIEMRLSRGEDRAKNAIRARSRLRSRHDPDAHTEALVRTYRSVVGVRSGRRRPPARRHA